MNPVNDHDRHALNTDDLILYLESLQGQLVRAARPGRGQLTQTAIEGLRTALEELRVSQEELIMARDIAEMERDRYQELFQFAPDAYIVTDPMGVIVEANSAAVRMFNMDGRFLRGKPLAVFVAKHQRVVFRAAIQRMREDTIGDWRFHIISRGHAQPVTVHVTARSVHANPSTVGTVRWQLHDLTEQSRQRTELVETQRELALMEENNRVLRQLAHERARVALALDAAGMGFWDWDLTTQTIYWDATHNRVIGLPSDQTRGNNQQFFERVHPADRELLARRVERALEAGEFDAEFRVIDETSPEGYRWVTGRGHRYLDPGSGPHMIGIVRDITELKRAQAASRNQKEQLEEAVQVRTGELLEVQNRLQSLTIELSRTAERERHLIASGIHDRVSQPLALARMMVGALKAAAPPERHSKLEDLSQLLGKAIEESRTLTFELSPPVLYELGLGAALEWLVEQTYEHFALKIEVNIHPSVERSAIELRVQLFQVIRELLTNITKHAGATGALIDLRTRGQKLRLCVCDNGKGLIGAAQQRRSSGFGLFHIRTQVQQLGGKFKIFSRSGRGTYIFARIPALTNVAGGTTPVTSTDRTADVSVSNPADADANSVKQRKRANRRLHGNDRSPR